MYDGADVWMPWPKTIQSSAKVLYFFIELSAVSERLNFYSRLIFHLLSRVCSYARMKLPSPRAIRSKRSG